MKVLLVSYAYATTPLNIFTGSQRAFSFTKYMICQGHKIVVMSHNNSSKLSIDIGEFGEQIYRVPDLIGLTENYFFKYSNMHYLNNIMNPSVITPMKSAF